MEQQAGELARDAQALLEDAQASIERAFDLIEQLRLSLLAVLAVDVLMR